MSSPLPYLKRNLVVVHWFEKSELGLQQPLCFLLLFSIGLDVPIIRLNTSFTTRPSSYTGRVCFKDYHPLSLPPALRQM